MLTVALLGLGARGGETYGAYAEKHPDEFKVVAVCDTDKEKVRRYGERFSLPESARYTDGRKLTEKKLADIAVISVFDRDHYTYAIPALQAGYDLILEKPVSPVPDECIGIRDTAVSLGRKVAVCHVMRYTSYYRKLKELLDSGAAGDIVAIEQTEDVAYWHMAHAFVRGNFRNEKETSPMILQKCCHDADLLVYLTGSGAKSVSSVGGLRHFRAENAPPHSADRCAVCSVRDCPYNAVTFYLDNFKSIPEGERDRWPYSQVVSAPTEARLSEALGAGRFGRCVYKCDNDVVDHQFVQIEFENGVHGTLTMCGFANNGGRRTHVYCTKGEYILDEQLRRIEVGLFGKPSEYIDFDTLSDDFSGHGGGDNAMMREIYQSFTGNGRVDTSIVRSIDSHLICFAAEESRHAGGVPVAVEDFVCRTKNGGRAGRKEKK